MYIYIYGNIYISIHLLSPPLHWHHPTKTSQKRHISRMALEPAWGERFRLGAGITTAGSRGDPGDRCCWTSHPVLWMRRKPTPKVRKLCHLQMYQLAENSENLVDNWGFCPSFPSEWFLHHRFIQNPTTFPEASGKQLATSKKSRHHVESAKLLMFHDFS